MSDSLQTTNFLFFLSHGFCRSSYIVGNRDPQVGDNIRRRRWFIAGYWPVLQKESLNSARGIDWFILKEL